MELSHRSGTLYNIFLGLAFVLSLSPFVCAYNLIVNGDFEQGNTGFTSEYTYDATPPMDWSTHYAVGTNPKHWNEFWASFGDHTSGQGKMLIVDGNTTTPLKTVWQQQVSVQPNTLYIFSFWAASTYPYYPAVLRTYINDVQVGNDLQLPSFETGKWYEFSVMWNSGSSSYATIRLVDQNTRHVGNDFVIDDISLRAVPLPATVWTVLTGISGMFLIRFRRSSKK